jgi:hypothetical protein
VEAAKHGLPSLAICSTAFTGLGRAQAKALGHAPLPIAVIPHPFGNRTRSEVRSLAEDCVNNVVRLLCGGGEEIAEATRAEGDGRAQLIQVPDEQVGIDRFFFERGWSDGLPIVAPTRERVAATLACTRRPPDEVVAKIAPGFGSATVERIAINAVMAGCYPEYLPVLIAAVEAVSTPKFNLSGVQATTNPAAVWMIVNGPIAQRLGVNGGANCLGPGSWANATLGRALRLILQNVGGGRAGEMDRATHGQPGKYTFCCGENESMNPWTPLHVERGFDPDASTVTVVAPLGTWNMNTHAKDADDLVKVIGDTMAFPASSDYVHGGSPWLLLAPEHAAILEAAGLGKADVKRRLWSASKLAASRLAARDLGRVQAARTAELGEITKETLLPISVTPDDINFIVAGGEGTHSVYIPVSGHSFPVTRGIGD